MIKDVDNFLTPFVNAYLGEGGNRRKAGFVTSLKI